MIVVLIEDDALLRETLAEDMVLTGLNVTQAPNAEAALETILAVESGSTSPFILVTDVNLGDGMDGLALVIEARRRWPEVGVVVMTGDPANIEGRCSDPREVLLLKPMGLSQVADAVHGLAGQLRLNLIDADSRQQIGGLPSALRSEPLWAVRATGCPETPPSR
jgi:DNA-binding NtrC family response regulator